MAAIDKIYIDSFEKYKLFKDWCRLQPKIKDKYGKETSLINYVFSYNEWEDAKKAQDEAYEAWEEAREGVQEKQNAADALRNLYYNASIDVEKQIKSLEASILNCKANIEEYKVNSAEQTLANAKEDIANLEAKIAVQEKVVADAKAAVDAYLATEEETPAE